MKLHDITLICVTGIKHQQSVNSLLRCLNLVEFDCIKFLSDIKSDIFDDRIEFVKINKLASLDDYSKFILYELYKYFNTKHCLIVQHDGYIVNPESWRKEFLDYDYIGAPWRINKCYVNKFGEMCRVGNGGFSLRSKKLLELPSKLKISFNIGEYNHEDLNFCMVNKHVYEKYGMRIAPFDIAKYFSHEFYLPEFIGINPFGIHHQPL